VHADVYDQFVARLSRGRGLKVGDPADPAPPHGARGQRLGHAVDQQYIEIGRQEGRLLTGGRAVAGLNGFFLERTVFVDVDPRAASRREIFGPVLAVSKARDFDQALAAANDTEFRPDRRGLHPRPGRLERANRKEFFVPGNLYLIGKCTGALVGVPPLRRFNMSGTTPRSGGARLPACSSCRGRSIAEKIR